MWMQYAILDLVLYREEKRSKVIPYKEKKKREIIAIFSINVVDMNLPRVLRKLSYRLVIISQLNLCREFREIN